MPLNKILIRQIMKEGKEVFDALEEYDRTHEMPVGRKRIDLTLDIKIINKLRKIRDKTGKPLSRLVEEAVIKVF